MNGTPVVFIIFNRVESATEVFDAIRRLKPRKLYIIADGPRSNVPDDVRKCRETRKLIGRVDWKCDVKKNFASVNMGCGERISSGLDWVFRREDRAIILEDDCVPSPAFFTYCAGMLERYHDDTRVMHINGSNFNTERNRNDDSYFFSRYVHVWGWATWRRAWSRYDYEMRSWPELKSGGRMKDMFTERKERAFWTHFFDLSYEKRIVPSTWDYQWLYTVWSNNGLCTTPKKNLVSNIGLTGIHTETKPGDPATKGFLQKRSDDFSVVKHPEVVLPDSWYDSYHFRRHFYQSIPKRIHRKLWRLFQ